MEEVTAAGDAKERNLLSILETEEAMEAVEASAKKWLSMPETEEAMELDDVRERNCENALERLEVIVAVDARLIM